MRRGAVPAVLSVLLAAPTAASSEALLPAAGLEGWRRSDGSAEVNQGGWRRLPGGELRHYAGGDGNLMLNREFDQFSLSFEYRSVDNVFFDSGLLVRQPSGSDIFTNQIGLSTYGIGGVFGNTVKDAAGVPVARVGNAAWPAWNAVRLDVRRRGDGTWRVDLLHNGVARWIDCTASGKGWDVAGQTWYGIGLQGEGGSVDYRALTIVPIGNAPPRVVAGDDVAIAAGSAVTLAALVTDDGQPAATSVVWSKVRGPGTVTFATAGAATTPAIFSASGTYELRCEASDGQLKAWDHLLVQVGAATVPSAPTVLRCSALTMAGPLDVRWNDTSLDETGFSIERSPDGIAWTAVGSTGRNVACWSASGLAQGVWWHRVRAVNAAGGSSSLVDWYDYGRPLAPRDPVATRPDATRISLGWTDVSRSNDRFVVQRLDPGATTWVEKARPMGTPWIDTVTAGLGYRYRILSRSDVFGDSDPVEIDVPAPTNTPPTIGAIADRTIAAGGSTGPIAFTIADAETAAAALTVSATASDPGLVPATGLVLGGGGSAREVTVTPAAGATVSATITLTVSDGQATVTTGFLLTVAANAAPQVGAAVATPSVLALP